MGCFTAKNFKFFNEKKTQFKESLLKAVELAGSQSKLVTSYSHDLSALLVPQEM